jgi:ERF superfamily protein
MTESNTATSITTNGVRIDAQPASYKPPREGAKPVLISKLTTIMGYVATVPKRGWNEHHKFNYSLEDDLTNAVREALVKQNLLLVESTEAIHIERAERPWKESVRDVFSTLVLTSHTLIDGDSGESLTFRFGGHACKTDDKGLYSCFTGAQKYAIQKLFLIASGNDPEQDDAAAHLPDQPLKPAPAKHGTATNDPAVQQRMAQEDAQFEQEEKRKRGRPAADIAKTAAAMGAKAVKTPEPEPEPEALHVPAWCDAVKYWGTDHKGETYAQISLHDPAYMKKLQNSWQPKPGKDGKVSQAQLDVRTILDESMEHLVEAADLKTIVAAQEAQ